MGLASAAIAGPCVFAIEAIESIFDDKVPVLGIGMRGLGKAIRKWLNAEELWEDNEPPSTEKADDAVAAAQVV